MPLIFIVEDEPEVSSMLALTLRVQNYEVAQAYDGKQAIEVMQQLLAQGQRPDLVLLDIMMPGLSGYDVALELRDGSSTADIPIIFVTAKSAEDDRVRGLQIADDYICKPFTTRDLLARVQTVLRRRELERQLKRLEQEGRLYPQAARDIANGEVTAGGEEAPG